MKEGPPEPDELETDEIFYADNSPLFKLEDE